ncbi:transketolase [bacterium]|nr:transketolase [bacterium]
MLHTSQSGHPGGSLSALDFLAVLYTQRLGSTHETVVVSNGHISPGVYSVLAEMGAIDQQAVNSTFRQIGSIYEGHVTRHVAGVHFGTGPLGVGVSAASGFAKAEKLKNSGKKVFAVMGDGEAQEGQVHEMALFAAKEKLNNFTVFCDYNRVQLTDSLADTMPVDVAAIFAACGWDVLEIDGHDHEALLTAINHESDKPVMIVGQTIMGYGVPMMESAGRNDKADWHGKAPSRDDIKAQLETPELTLSAEEEAQLDNFRKDVKFNPGKNSFTTTGTPLNEVSAGEAIVYDQDTLTDCRSAYGKALLSLAQANETVLAGTADLGGSVMTKFVKSELPDQHIEFGICEQNMVSVAGGLSFSGFTPFVSTFGAFMSSRAKDQARVNDINQTNVKMVSTHCGLSVGEDGPTHQAIDDMGSFLGMFNTMVAEPADPNQCDRIIRYMATHYGNCYVRMGRHKLPVLTKADGSILFDKDYQYSYGRTDILREGSALTIVASGPMVIEAQKAVEAAGIDAEILIASSPKQFDDGLKKSLEKTGKVMVIEDHNAKSGFASQVTLYAAQNNITLHKFKSIAVGEYQLSGSPAELYDSAGIGSKAIEMALSSF